MGVKLNISLLLTILSVTAAASLQEDNAEGDARLLFSNYTSGLLALMSVNSSTYSLATLVLGGGALLLAIVYLWTVAPAELANTEYSQYYRADNTGNNITLLFLSLFPLCLSSVPWCPLSFFSVIDKH